MSIFRKLEQYFYMVLKTNEFIIAIDSTGVYLFQENEENDVAIAHAMKLLQILALDEEEAKLIFVVPESDKVYDSFSYEEKSVRDFVLEVGRSNIEDLVRKLTGVRDNIFTQADINSIIDCFQDVKEEESPFQKTLCGIGLTADEARRFEIARPDSINDLIELGCPKDIVEEVYEAFKEYYIQNNMGFEQLDNNNYITIEKNMKQYRFGGVAATLVALAVWVFGYTHQNLYIYSVVIAVLVASVAINMLNKSIKLRSTVVARICFVLNLALVFITVIPPLGKWLTEKLIWLVDSMRTIVVTDYFKDLHW